MLSSMPDDPFMQIVDNQYNVPSRLKELIEDIIATKIPLSQISERLLRPTAADIDTGALQAKKRRARKPWDENEIKKLLVGINICGVGNWSHIHASLGFDPNRTFTDLKDKWRNLCDPRSNSRTPVHFKKIALYIKDTQNKNEKPVHTNSTQKPPKMSDVTWEEAYMGLVSVSDSIEPSHIQMIQPIQYANITQCTAPYMISSDYKQDDSQWCSYGIDFDAEKYF